MCPVGHSTNLAARMEQMATPGSILVTAYTHKLTEGYFEFKDLGRPRSKESKRRSTSTKSSARDRYAHGCKSRPGVG